MSIAGLIAFVTSALRVGNPIIDLHLFANLNFLMANVVNFVRAVAIFGSLFLLPLFLQNLLQYTALNSGIILAPLAVAVAIASPFSGLISDRVGPRIPMTCGVALLVLSLYLFRDLSLNADYWFLFWPQVIRGVGLGLINAPLMSAAMNSVRREQVSGASRLLTVIMQVGGALGVALLGATLQRREFFHYAQYLQQFDNAFSPQLAKALALMQELLLRQGVSPADAVVKGKSLLVLWVQKQAAVSAFGDAFVFAAFLIAIGIIPALLIRRIRPAHPSPPAAVAD